MGAGLLQLSIIGEQDKYLTNNPQMTYFKSVYKKYHNASFFGYIKYSKSLVLILVCDKYKSI